MKVPLRWLSEFITLPELSPSELSDIIAMIGHEVEGFEVLEADWSDVVVGQVVDIKAHPDADKIRVCQVDVGAGPEQIICGAWNFENGAYVAVARPGAVLPGGFEIGQRTIRGVDSNGMICSDRELGLGDDHSGILVLDGEPSLGIDFSELVELPDVVFDITVTPNRPDAMSLRGIARDLGAYLDLPYRTPERELNTVPGATGIEVELGDPVGCRRFTAREIRGVSVGKSPLWVRHRMAKAGMRAISNVVDVTNYVMLELGHPLHAFDADSIVGRHLVVKRAAAGEQLVTLDDETRTLSHEDLIIYDEEGPTSMSGTMGGARSEVSDGTVNVLMEAASWDPPTIMYMSRRHNLRSEASTRFERGVDPNLADEANRRATAMVAELAGGEVPEGAIDVVGTVVDPATIRFELAEVTRLLGPGFTHEEVSAILGRLGMSVEGEDPMTVVVPTFRPDVTRPADLVEEVARIHGFDKFDATVPTGPAGGLTPEQKRLRVLHRSLVGIGISQAVTLPFVGEEDVLAFGVSLGDVLRVKNPLRDEEGRLRPTMLPSLLNAVRFNLSHGASSVALFETGRVFAARPGVDDSRLPEQVERLAWVAVGPVGVSTLDEPGLEADGRISLGILRHVAGALGLEGIGLTAATPPGYHPGRTAAVTLNGSAIGYVGELSPTVASGYEILGRVAVAELDLDPLLASPGLVQSESPSVYPPVDFDLSFLVADSIPVSSVLGATVDAGGAMVESAHVFDEFKGAGIPDGSRALAIRYRLRAPDRTLTNEEVSPVRGAMIEAATAVGAQLRGA
ncbi:MAG TPA: phenylalanine--tRNA ligase subunit beta [Acidimicrobiia bacterium]